MADRQQLTSFAKPTEIDRARFQTLTEQWRRERGAASSTTEIVLCPSYQTIIGMGEKAIPLILNQLRAEGDEPDHWFWALRAMTGTNPIPPEDQGNMSRMARAWLAWAASEGYGG